MKHLLNNLSSEEKNSIREQYEGGMSVDTSKFRSLLESKLGDAKPLISEDDKTDKANKCGHSTWERYEKSGWKCEPIINCSQLDNKISDQISSIVDQKFFSGGKGKPLVRYSYSTYDEPNKVQGEITNQDPYSYVKLFNGKYCSKHDESKNWVEVKETAAIEAVKKAMSVNTNDLIDKELAKKGY